jgi:hypothetical protein
MSCFVGHGLNLLEISKPVFKSKFLFNYVNNNHFKITNFPRPAKLINFSKNHG